MVNPLTTYRQRHDPPITQAELARKLDISRSYLKRIESGERQPGIDVLRKVKDRLGIPPGALRPDLAADAALFTEAAE